MKTIIQNKAFLILMLWSNHSIGFSATYFYELYLHNEYYSEPPGFPSKILVSPIISEYSGVGVDWQEKRFSGGLVESVRLTRDHSWIEFIFGIGKENVKFNNQGQLGNASRVGWDDFLIDMGHNFLDKTGNKQLLLHLLIGIPLHWKVTLADINQPLWGTRTYAIGPVVEIAYDFIRKESVDFFVGALARYIHKFKRSYEPILPSDALYNPGNLLNLLGLIHYRYNQHNIEAGYVYSLYYNMANQLGPQITHLPTQRYNSFYIDYFYFYDPLSVGLEFGFAKNYGNIYNGTEIFGLIAWYF